MIYGKWFERDIFSFKSEGEYSVENCETGVQMWFRRFKILGVVKRFRVVFAENPDKPSYAKRFAYYCQKYDETGFVSLYPPYSFRCGLTKKQEEKVLAMAGVDVFIEYVLVGGFEGRRKLC